MSTSSDASAVIRHDEHQLREFLAARRAGDEVSARRWWDELVRDNFDRVRGMVVLRSRGHLSPDEQDEALQRALIRLSGRMFHTFEGTSMGEWINATKTLVFGACVDTQRRRQVVSRRETSLEAGEDGARFTGEVLDALAKRHLEQEADGADADGHEWAVGFLDWAVPRLSARRRAVIELDRQGVACEEIQERLGVSRDVVYASRSRALKDLTRLRAEYIG